jgi:hypothetical protein
VLAKLQAKLHSRELVAESKAASATRERALVQVGDTWTLRFYLHAHGAAVKFLQRTTELEREISKLVYKLELREGELKMTKQAAATMESVTTFEARDTKLARDEAKQKESELTTAKAALRLLQEDWSAKSAVDQLSKLSVAQLGELR